jgi:hypothetical protein
MEIQHSIISQAVYGENGRAALPLNMFTKKSNDKQIGGEKKDIEHLGVPLVLALVEINLNKPCNHANENMFDEPQIEQVDEYKQGPEEFETIPDEMYDSLLNTVLEEPIEEIPDSNTYNNNEDAPMKKYTRKNSKQ